jgi:hypothetical protein
MLKGNFGDERMVLGLRKKGACTISGLGALERRIAGNGYQEGESAEQLRLALGTWEVRSDH